MFITIVLCIIYSNFHIYIIIYFLIMALFNNWFSEFLKIWRWLCWAGESSVQHTSTWRAPHSHSSVLTSLCSGPLPHPSSLFPQGCGTCCFPCLAHPPSFHCSKVAMHSLATQLWQPFCLCLYPCMAVLSPQGLSLSGILHILFVHCATPPLFRRT